ncbi:MAG: glycosyltransferase [Gammaproteobacteria bacterium]
MPIPDHRDQNTAPLAGHFPLDRTRLPDEVIRRIHWWTGPAPVHPLIGKKRLNSSLRIAAIVGNRLWNGLRYEGTLLLLTPHTWRAVLTYGRPDLLIVESCWETATGHWYLAQTGRTGESAELREILALAGANGTPRIFWHTQDHGYHGQYREFARHFDFVFCADEREAQALCEAGVDTDLLSPAVQPAIFNPYRPYGFDDSFDIGLLLDGIVDLLRDSGQREVLSRLRSQGLKLIDSHSLIFAKKMRDLEGFEGNLLGCVTAQGRLTAMKYARIALMLESHLTVTEQRWRALETAACYTPIVHFGRLPEGDLRKDLVIEAASEDSLPAAIAELRENESYRKRTGHLAWRQACVKHSFSRRVNSICTKAGITHDWIEHPLVSIIVPTFTTERLPDCVSLIDRQDYANKELLILYKEGPAAAELASYVAARKDLRVIYLPRDEDADSGMKAGINAAHGEYWFKMNIDHRYGDRYVSDIMLHLSARDADVVGKPPRYYSFASEPLIYQVVPPDLPELCILPPQELTRRKAWLDCSSLAGKKAVAPYVRFSDPLNATADTTFTLQLGRTDLEVLILDPLNLVTVRGSDRDDRTWVSGAGDPKGQGHPLANPIEDVFV